MRYGIKTAPQHCTWQDMLDIWRLADDIELFESAWNFDHFYPLVGDTDGPCMEAWVTLSALAQATSRIRVGAMVNGIHYRHPAVVANMAASLDIVSAGRLDLGLGAGWHEEESAAYGIRLGGLKERFDRFDEGVEVVVKMLSQETTDFHGEFFQIASARCEPKGPAGASPADRHRGWRREANSQDRREMGTTLEPAVRHARVVRSEERGVDGALCNRGARRIGDHAVGPDRTACRC